MQQSRIEKVNELLFSADYQNIVLALELMKSLDMHLHFQLFKDLAIWLQEVDEFDYESDEELLYRLMNLGRLNIYFFSFEHQAAIPDSIYLLKKLKYLQIFTSNADYEYMPPSIFMLENLETLIIHDSIGAITSIPDELGKLTKLKQMELTGAIEFESIPETIGNLQQLEKLSIGLDEMYCYEPNRIKISSLPASICRLQNLKKLELHHTSVEELPNNIADLYHLEQLTISNNKIKKLPPDIVELKQLRVLNIHESGITQLPSDFDRLSQLNVLSLSNCSELRYLPSELMHLKNLKQLNISHCRAIASIPPLTNIEELDLSSLAWISVPSSVLQMKRLKVLNLALNKLEKVGAVLEALPLLKHLNLIKNPLVNQDIQTLRTIYSDCTLLYSPSIIKSVKAYVLSEAYDDVDTLIDEHYIDANFEQHLHLIQWLTSMGYACTAQTLKDKISWLHAFKVLDLSQRNLTTIDQSIQLLTNLEVLNLRQNVLTKLPKCIFNMAKLKVLDLSFNTIEKLPIQLYTSHRFSFHEINIQHNPTMIKQVRLLQKKLSETRLIV